MNILIYAFCFFTSLVATGLYAQDNIVDSSTQETFPREVSFEYNGKQYQLQATGVATRKKLIIKVYSVAHYLQKNVEKPNADKIQEIMSDDNAKQLSFKWVREVGVDKIQEAFQDSFHRVFSAQEYDQLKSEIDNFVQFFNQTAHKGDTFILRWIPGGYIEVLINGNKAGSISNQEFAKGLWSIWFGEKSIVNRNDLISQMK